MTSSYPFDNGLIGTLGASVVCLIGILAAVWWLLQMRHRTMLAKVQLAHQKIQRQGALELEEAHREITSMRREIDLLSRKLRETSRVNGAAPAAPGRAIQSKRRPDSFIVVDDVLGSVAEPSQGFADTAILPDEPEPVSHRDKRTGVVRR